MAIVDRELTRTCPKLIGFKGEKGACNLVLSWGGERFYDKVCTPENQKDYEIYGPPPTDGSPGKAGEKYLSKDRVDKENIRNSGRPRVTCRAGCFRLLIQPNIRV